MKIEKRCSVFKDKCALMVKEKSKSQKELFQANHQFVMTILLSSNWLNFLLILTCKCNL